MFIKWSGLRFVLSFEWAEELIIKPFSRMKDNEWSSRYNSFPDNSITIQNDGVDQGEVWYYSAKSTWIGDKLLQ